MSFLLEALDRKVIVALAGVFIVGWLFLISRTHSTGADYDQALCQGPPLRTLEAREAAQVEGYDINRRYDCIEKKSFERIAAQKAKWQQNQAQAALAKATAVTEEPKSLHQARQKFHTRVVVTLDHPLPLPTPPAKFPTLRGGNGNARAKEFFFGEVDDVLAAADHLAQLGYVDPGSIYLGGHSTGGTLALLTAETSGRFKAVFAFGAVARVDHYPLSIAPVNLMRDDERESRLRSPIHWLDGITSPTYVIEGKVSPSNIGELEDLCSNNKRPLLHCIAATGVDHFSVLRKVSRVFAARIVISAEGVPFVLGSNEF